MRILYIFPHPDDESFGPAPAIAKQKREGHQVSLLTLTKGGATQQRFKYNYSIEEMGEVRAAEMQDVASVLQLDDLTIKDFPDNGMKELDPRELEAVIANHIHQLNPDIIVTYAVHGISGFPDHLVAHAVVKRVFAELQDQNLDYANRLAFFTLSQHQAEENEGRHPLKYSEDQDIDCAVTVQDKDLEKMKKALDQYKTYQEVIRETQVKETIGEKVCFELFRENFTPPLSSLSEQL